MRSVLVRRPRSVVAKVPQLRQSLQSHVEVVAPGCSRKAGLVKISSEDVLLIEDDMKLAKSFSEALEEDEIHCCVAHEADAVNVAAAWQPGLILLDAGSYRMEGLPALEELRHNKFTAQLPVIILSGNTDRYVIERLFANGIIDYWALHELSPETLVRRVKRWFASSSRANSETGVAAPLHQNQN